MKTTKGASMRSEFAYANSLMRVVARRPCLATGAPFVWLVSFVVKNFSVIT